MKQLFVFALTFSLLAPPVWGESFDNAGNLKTVVKNGTGANAVNIQDGGNSITVDGTVAATQSGTWTEANSVSIKTGVELIDDTVGTVGSGVLIKGLAILGSDGTNHRLVKTDTSGELQVDVLTTPGVAVDKSAFTEGTTNFRPTGGVYNETISSDPSEDQAAAVRITAKRGLHVNLRNASGGEIGTSGSPVRIDPTGSTTQPVSGTVTANAGTGTFTVSGTVTANAGTGTLAVSVASGASTIAKAEDGASADGDVGVPTMAVRKATPANTSGADGDYEVLQMSAGRLWTSTTVDAALPAGTNNIGDVDVLTLPGVAGTSAHDAAVSGNPVRVGGRARSSDVTAVANDDTTDLVADLNGKLVTLPYALYQNYAQGGQTTSMTGTSDTAIIAAPGAGIKLYVTSVTCTNGHATVGTYINIKDGTTTLFSHYAVAAGGGFHLSFQTPWVLSANTALNAANATTGSDTRCSATAYKAP